MKIDKVLSARWGNDEHTHFVITLITDSGRKCELPCRWDSDDPVKADLAQRAMGGEYGEIEAPRPNEVDASPRRYFDHLIGSWVRKDEDGKWRDGLGKAVRP